MSPQDSPPRLAKAHLLTAELRALQARMNETVDQLCELVGGDAVQALLKRGATPQSGQRGATFTPSFLTSPAAQTYHRSPSPGAQIAPDTLYFSDKENSLVQIVQQPLLRHQDSRYSLVINVADFDGAWMSLVIDARSLLSGMPTGKASLGLMLEATATAQVTMSSKITWRGAELSRDVALDVHPNQVSVVQADLGTLIPETTESLDLHLMFNPPARGSVEIRRLTLTLDIQAEQVKPPHLDGVFEDGL